MASENGCLADFAFVAKKLITLCGFITPPTNVNTDYILYFELLFLYFLKKIFIIRQELVLVEK